MKRARESHVTPVCHRSDDEAHLCAHVLVAIPEAGVGLADAAVVVLLLPVEPELATAKADQ